MVRTETIRDWQWVHHCVLSSSFRHWSSHFDVTDGCSPRVMVLTPLVFIPWPPTTQPRTQHPASRSSVALADDVSIVADNQSLIRSDARDHVAVV